MFSPEASIQGSTVLRNPRRRQRTILDESLAALPSTKRRKRSSLAPDSFEGPLTRQTNDHHGSVDGNANGLVTSTRKASVAGLDITSLTITGQSSKKGKKEKRGDQVLLAKTDNYTVTHNNKIPAPLQDIIDATRSSKSNNNTGDHWRAEIFTDLGHAVAVTHGQAFIWRHGSSTETVPSIISLPQSTRSANVSQETLPIPTLVYDSSSGELALLIVMPCGGRITYWDNVLNAANVDNSRQKQQALHGVVNGLYSSEIITKTLSAEPDGFLLATSNGRLMHLSIKDAQGRPSISVHNLREESTSNNSLFGTIKGVLSGTGWSKSIAAMHALPVQVRSRRKCIVATNHGLFQVWSFQRQSSKSLEYELDAKQAIVHACRSLGEPVERYKFQLLDFALMAKAPGDTRHGQRVMAMVAFDNGQSNSYYFVDMVLGEAAPDIDLTYEITGLSTPSAAPGSSIVVARLLIPSPPHTAFIMLDSALVLVSLSQLTVSPSSQLQMEADNVNANGFIEILPFNRAREYHLFGCGVEDIGEPGETSACTFFLSNLGLCTITTSAVEAGETKATQLAKKARTNLEQAVFYGSTTDNFIDFQDTARWKDLDDKEITAAAIQVSDSIIDSTSRYIPRLNPTLDHQLNMRIQALADLNKIVGKTSISREARWYLLANAEKMAAAKALWQSFNDDLRRPARGGNAKINKGREQRYLPLVISSIHRDYWKNYPLSDVRELDEEAILQWYLLHEVSQLKYLVPYAEAVPGLYSNAPNWSSPRQQVALVSQGTELIFVLLRAAFKYREENAQFYGIGKDMFEDGLYQGLYDMAEVPWMSAFPDNIREHVNNCIETADKYVDADAESVPFNEVKKIVQDLPELVHLCCRTYQDHGRYLASRTSEEAKKESAEWNETYLLRRYEMIVRLDELEIAEEGIKIADRHEDMRALSQLIVASTMRYQKTLTDGQAEDEADFEDLRAKLTLNQQRIDHYFEKFGSKWTEPFCNRLITVEKASWIMSQESKHHDQIVAYLRKNPEAARIRWISEVTVEQDYRRAANSILEASRTEASLWGGTVIVSLAKLSQMAARECGRVSMEEGREFVAKQEDQLFVHSVQQRLEEMFRSLTLGAIDAQAEIEILVDTFCDYVQDKPALRQRLNLLLRRVVEHIALSGCDLIDLITLISNNSIPLNDNGFQQERFFLALRVNSIINKRFDNGNYQLYDRLIWLRALLQDDWPGLNQLEGQLEEVLHNCAKGTALWSTIKAGYQAGLFDRIPPPSPLSLKPASESTMQLCKTSHFNTEPEAVVAAIVNDHIIEFQALERMLSEEMLEAWWQAVVDAVKNELSEEIEADEYEQTRMAQEKQILNIHAIDLSSFAWADMEDEDGGSSKPLTNGVKGGTNGRIHEDEDVDMLG